MPNIEIKKVSVFSIANPEHAIASLRIISPLTEAGVAINWFRPGQEYTADLIDGSDLVIIQRDYPRYFDDYFRIHLDAYRREIPVIFEIDDLLWELPEGHPDRASHYYTEALVPMLFAAWAADGITVPSAGLKQYLSWVNPNTFVLPNCINPEVWSIREPDQRDDGKITIGYMGGESHKPDLQMIESVILDILDSYHRDVKFIFWGVQPPASIMTHPQVEWIPLTPGNYSEFATYFSQQVFDIYIAPLEDSQFNRCKSSIKVMEYSTLGVSGVSSNLEPYSSVITQGNSGLLAETPYQWSESLRSLIEKPDLRFKLASQAQAKLQEEWLIIDHYHKWLETFNTIKDSYKPKPETPQMLNLMASICEQESDQIQQLFTKHPSKQDELNHLNESQIMKASRALKLKLQQIIPGEAKHPDQEMLDES